MRSWKKERKRNEGAAAIMCVARRKKEDLVKGRKWIERPAPLLHVYYLLYAIHTSIRIRLQSCVGINTTKSVELGLINRSLPLAIGTFKYSFR
jgi:hypothetical protein